MSRSLTAGVITEVTGAALSPVMLLKAEFTSGNLLLWSGVGTLTYNSEDYVGAGHLLSMSEVVEVSGVEAQGANFQLSGIPSSIISTALTEDYQGKFITCFFAVMDSSRALIADPYQLFKGRMDVLEITDGGDTATLTMRAENKLIDLNRIKISRYTMEDQQAKYPTDTGLEFITSLQDKEIVWGRKSPKE